MIALINIKYQSDIGLADQDPYWSSIATQVASNSTWLYSQGKATSQPVTLAFSDVYSLNSHVGLQL